MAMYSWVPESVPVRLRVDPVDLDVLGLLGRVGVALDQVVEGPLGIEHEGMELAGPGAVDPGGLVGERVEAQRVGQPAGRDRWSPRRRGDPGGPPARAMAAAVVVLPTPPEPQQMMIDRSSDHLVDGSAGGVIGGTAGRVGRASHPGRQGGAQDVELAGADGGGEEEGHPQLGQGKLVGQSVQLLLLELLAGQPELPGPSRARQRCRVEDYPGPLGGRSAGRRVQSLGSGG